MGNVWIKDHAWERHEDGRWSVTWEVATFGGVFRERRERHFPLKAEAVAFARKLNEGSE